MTGKIGLLVGREHSFPEALIEAINRGDQDVQAELISLGGTSISEPNPYRVIVDRISHDVPYYRSYLKQAALSGVTVVNNPFMWSADDKFFGASLALRLGVSCPKTIALPNKDYGPGIVHPDSLRNLVSPLDWEAIVDHVGLPCVLKDVHGDSQKQVFVCHSLEELIYNYDQSGLRTMVVQQFIDWQHYVRCFCLGQEEVLPIKYDPGQRRYDVNHEHLTAELGAWIIDDSLKLVRALGYDFNAIEWAIRDGVPYAIDFMNPAPEIEIHSLTPFYFDWVVEHTAQMVIEMAGQPNKARRASTWRELFAPAK